MIGLETLLEIFLVAALFLLLTVGVALIVFGLYGIAREFIAPAVERHTRDG